MTLHIGDKSPVLKYSKWIKGQAVDVTNSEKIYVVEFWATWCGPCIAAMPHLSFLQEKYKNEAVFIGVNVLEGAKSSSKKRYEDYLPSIMRFVNSSANRMSYSVIADNNEEFMYHGWLEAAGLEGIPQTFIIKDGKVAWIGDPTGIEKVLDALIHGSFDMSANKKASETRAEDMRNLAERIKSAYKSVQDAESAGNYGLAMDLADEYILKIPELGQVMKVEKMKILFLKKEDSKAIAYGRELAKQKGLATMIGTTICEGDNYSKDAYLLAAESLLSVNPTNCLILDKAALSYSKAGDFKAAAETEQKAVEHAKLEYKDPKFSGRVFDYTVTDFEATFRKYQAKIN